jgi:hypothetical protein
MIKDSVNIEVDNSLMLSYLKSAQSLSVVIKKISKVQSVLLDKRTTVAEKAIQEELALCAELESFFLHSLSRAVKKKCFYISENNCLKLRQINIKLKKQLKAFIKAAKYNLNYLEQYFEHDFWLELTHNKFAEQLSRIKEEIEIKKY